MNKVEQTISTSNHSTVQYTHNHIFLFDANYSAAEFENNSEAEATLKPGSLIIRKANDATKVVSAVAGETLANVIGITANETDIVLIGGGTSSISYATKGTINKDLLALPSGVTLDTIVAGKTVADILQAIGFRLEGSVENTKFDN